MKENFDRTFIKRIVKEFVGEITDPDERKLLKYLSLINTYDLKQNALPHAAFDRLMTKVSWKPISRGRKLAVLTRWENTLSKAFLILMNETSKPAMGFVWTLRITNPLLSEEILKMFLESRGERETISGIAKEFLDNDLIFGSQDLARNTLLKIFRELLKFRGSNPYESPDTRYSPIISAIISSESHEIASEVLHKGFNLTSDPILAQQMARLFIDSQDWQKAFKFAKIATDMQPENSFFLDTFGRIHEKQLSETLSGLKSAQMKLPVQELCPIVKLGVDGLHVFRRVQSLGDQKKTWPPNNAGYYGELHMINSLLNCLEYAQCFKDKSALKNFLNDDRFTPVDLDVLLKYEGQNYLEDLKLLKENQRKAITRIEDESIQLRSDALVMCNDKNDHYLSELVKLKQQLSEYFGENEDATSLPLPESEVCAYRRRRIFALQGNSIGSLFNLRHTEDGEENLVRICSIQYANMKSQYANAYDYMTMISVYLALTSMNPKHAFSDRISFDELVSWSQKLYEFREKMQSIHLESFLYHLLFKWPRPNTKQSLTYKTIGLVLSQWKEAYDKKYWRQDTRGTGEQIRKKDTTLFFLASGTGIASIYTTCEDRSEWTKRSYSFWQSPEMLKTLQRFQGQLCFGGKEVSALLHDGTTVKGKVKIPTSMPISTRELWNRGVYFVIGFSWAGPKAFDISPTNPSAEENPTEGQPEVKYGDQVLPGDSASHKEQQTVSPELTLQQEIRQLDDQLRHMKHLKKIKKKRTLTKEEQEKLNGEQNCMTRREKLLQDQKKQRDAAGKK